MKSVASHAVAHHLGIDARSTAPGELKLFQNHDAGAFADHKTIAIQVEGSRRVSWIVITRRKRPQSGEPSDAHGRDGRFGATANHCIGIAALDDLEAVADRVRPG